MKSVEKMSRAELQDELFKYSTEFERAVFDPDNWTITELRRTILMMRGSAKA